MRTPMGYIVFLLLARHLEQCRGSGNSLWPEDNSPSICTLARMVGLCRRPTAGMAPRDAARAPARERSTRKEATRLRKLNSGEGGPGGREGKAEEEGKTGQGTRRLSVTPQRLGADLREEHVSCRLLRLQRLRALGDHLPAFGCVHSAAQVLRACGGAGRAFGCTGHACTRLCT